MHSQPRILSREQFASKSENLGADLRKNVEIFLRGNPKDGFFFTVEKSIRPFFRNFVSYETLTAKIIIKEPIYPATDKVRYPWMSLSKHLSILKSLLIILPCQLGKIESPGTLPECVPREVRVEIRRFLQERISSPWIARLKAKRASFTGDFSQSAELRVSREEPEKFDVRKTPTKISSLKKRRVT